MTEQLWNLAEVCATTRFPDDMVVRTPDDKNWSTTVGKLRSLSDDVIASASNAATWSEAITILNAGTIAQMRAAGSFPVPDPYATALAAMRAASNTDFDASWKADRHAALTAEHRRLDAHLTARPSPPRLTAAEVKSYAPPDPYAAGIAAMRSERR